jgi:hypothetical protein
MIEEMYQQEFREPEGSSAVGGGPESRNDPSGADGTHSPSTLALRCYRSSSNRACSMAVRRPE